VWGFLLKWTQLPMSLADAIGESSWQHTIFRMGGMSRPEDKPVPVVGAYWIDEKDYPALLRIFADGDRMPRT
jgi:hypothetical protein